MKHATTLPPGPARPGRRSGIRGAIVLSTLLPALCAAHPSATAQREIESLLRAVGGSGCHFLRGGTAHPAAEAQQHLQKKYDYMAKRNMLASAEDFIDKAATRSSMSGEPYAIRCGESPAVPSDAWLRARLQAIRQAGARGSPGAAPLHYSSDSGTKGRNSMSLTRSQKVESGSSVSTISLPSS